MARESPPTTATPDFAAEGLADGLQGEARSERLELLKHLHDEGFTLDALRSAIAENRLVLLGGERALAGRERYSINELLERVAIDPEFLAELRRALGLPTIDPEERALTDAELRAAELGRVALEQGLPKEDILDVTRVLGRGLSQAAEAMRAITLKLVFDPGASERELALRYEEVVERLSPLTGPLVAEILRMYQIQVARNEVISATALQVGQQPGAREITICFADLVGFTRVGEEVPADELGRLATRLETLTAEALRPQVRLVKTLGDAVMLTAPEPPALLDTALDLVAAADAEAEDFPQLRAGVAWGTALQRAGDWYGHPVNLASRVTAIARPGSVLATREVRDAAPDDYRWSFIGERRLKGLRGPVPLFRARRAEQPESR